MCRRATVDAGCKHVLSARRCSKNCALAGRWPRSKVVSGPGDSAAVHLQQDSRRLPEPRTLRTDDNRAMRTER